MSEPAQEPRKSWNNIELGSGSSRFGHSLLSIKKSRVRSKNINEALLTAWSGLFNILSNLRRVYRSPEKTSLFVDFNKESKSIISSDSFLKLARLISVSKENYRLDGIEGLKISGARVTRTGSSRLDSEKYKRLRSISCKIWKLRRASKAVYVGGTRCRRTKPFSGNPSPADWRRVARLFGRNSVLKFTFW
jgi:hypothetical protein